MVASNLSSHKWRGNLVSAPQRMAMKWFLNGWMAHSAALRRWMCGGTNW